MDQCLPVVLSSDVFHDWNENIYSRKLLHVVEVCVINQSLTPTSSLPQFTSEFNLMMPFCSDLKLVLIIYVDFFPDIRICLLILSTCIFLSVYRLKLPIDVKMVVMVVGLGYQLILLITVLVFYILWGLYKIWIWEIRKYTNKVLDRVDRGHSCNK